MPGTKEGRRDRVSTQGWALAPFYLPLTVPIVLLSGHILRKKAGGSDPVCPGQPLNRHTKGIRYLETFKKWPTAKY